MMPVNSNPTVRPGVADVDAALRYPRTCKGGMPHTHNIFSTAPAVFKSCLHIPKGLAKLGNIVAEPLLRAQMFLSLATHKTLLRMLQGGKCYIRDICFLV